MDLFWFHIGTIIGKVSPMAVSLSIKNVSEELAAGLRARAARNHRSLQGELLAIIEQAVAPDHRVSTREILALVKRLKLSTGDEAEKIVRADRSAR